MAETATNDDRVKDRLGGWQDSETRKSIYQDRETDDLRAQAASVRRQLRTGKGLAVPIKDVAITPAPEQAASRASIARNVDAADQVWASLTLDERQALLQHRTRTSKE
jgi:hypothetical protein